MLEKLSIFGTAVVLPLFIMLGAWVNWQFGNRDVALLSIATIPVIFLCWGLSYWLAGPQVREIARNMTRSERDELNRMAFKYGLKMGIFFALPIGILCGGVYFTFEKSAIATIVTLLVAIVLFVPFGKRQSKRVREYLYRTNYAKEQALSVPRTDGGD